MWSPDYTGELPFSVAVCGHDVEGTLYHKNGHPTAIKFDRHDEYVPVFADCTPYMFETTASDEARHISMAIAPRLLAQLKWDLDVAFSEAMWKRGHREPGAPVYL